MTSQLKKKKSKKSKRRLSLDSFLDESTSSLTLADLDESLRSDDSLSPPPPSTSDSVSPLMSPQKASPDIFRRRKSSSSPRKRKGSSKHKRTIGRKAKSLTSIEPLLIQDDLAGISSSAVDDKNTTKAKAKGRKSKKKLQQHPFHDSSNSMSSGMDDSARSNGTESTSSSEASRTFTLSPKSRNKNSKKSKKKNKQRSSSNSLETATTADMDESWASFEEGDADMLPLYHQIRSPMLVSPRPRGVPKFLTHSSLADLAFNLDDDDDDEDDYVKGVDDDDDDDDYVNEEKQKKKEKKKKKKKKKDLPSIQEEDPDRSRSSRSRRRETTSNPRRPLSNSPTRRRKDRGDSPSRRSTSVDSLRRRRRRNNNRSNKRPMALRSCIKGARVEDLHHSKQEHNVHFLEMVNIFPVIPVLELVRKRSELWFRQKDYDKILTRSMNIALKVKQGKKTSKCIRGLEHFLKDKTERYASWNAVLVEQEVQHLANKCLDDNRIQQVYLEASTTCRVEAQERGQKDWEAIQDYLWETL